MRIWTLLLLFPLSISALEMSCAAMLDDPLDAPPKPAPFKLNEEERSRILDLFQASNEAITPHGELTLTYDFASKEETLGEDWAPIPTNPFGKIGKAVRWTRGGEAGVVGVKGGIYLADKGQWFHRGVWQPQVKMSADYYSFCGGSVGDMFCSVFAWTKGLRRRVGSNLGSQMMRISGVKPAGGIGKAPEIIFREPIHFGFDLRDGNFAAQRSGRTLQQSSSSKFLKKLDSGQVGFVWNGNIRGCVPKVTISGKLDLEWAAKSIPALEKRLAEYNKKKPSS